MLWDRGFWMPEGTEDVDAALRKGELKFTLAGEKLKGSWVLVRMKHDRERRQAQQLAADQAPRRVRARGRAVARRRTTRSLRAAPWRRSPPARAAVRSRSWLQAPRRPTPAPSGTRTAPRRRRSPVARRGQAASVDVRAQDGKPGGHAMPRLHRAAALQDAVAAAARRRLGARDQVRRLPHAAARRGRRGHPAHAQGPRLDRQVPGHRRGRRALARLRSSTARSWRSTTAARRTSPPCRRRSPRADRRTWSSSPSICCSMRGEDLRALPLSERKDAPARRCWPRAGPPRASATSTTSPERRRRGAAVRLPHAPGGHHLQAARRALSLRPHRELDQVQVPRRP